MVLNVHAAIGYVWGALGMVWLAGLAFTKPTVRSQAAGARIFHLVLALTGFFLLGSTAIRPGWLGMRFLPDVPALGYVGLGLTGVGCLFAIWARLTLGGNWSARATVKAGHELIVRGPYALARHPIYTGLLLASLGTMLAGGEWRCVVGIVLVAVAFAIKMSQEELLMMETFPHAYPLYRQRVKALIPGVI